MVLMEHWVLSISPLSMGIWHWWVLGQDSSEVHPEQVWVVQQGSHHVLVVVESDWSFVSQSSAGSSGQEEKHVTIHNTTSHVETLDWQFSDQSDGETASELSSGCYISPIPI